MAEEKDTTKDDVEFDDEGKPIVKDNKAGGEGGESDPDKKDGEDQGDADNQKKDFDDEAEPEVPVRKSALQHIIARKNDKIKKLESKQDQGDGGNSDNDDTDDDGDDGLTPEAKGAVDKVVEAKLKPLKDKLVSDADEGELQALISDEPNSKKYEKHIRAYMGHETYKGVPPSVIFHHLAFTQALAIGAKKKEAADAEANGTKSGGRSLQPDTTKGTDGLPTAEAIANMSDEEFSALENDARQGKFVK